MAADAADSLARLLDAHGHGVLDRSVGLRGTVSLPSGASADAWLCSTDQGAFVVALGEGDDCVVVDVWTASPLDLEWRLLGDQLTVGAHRLTVPVSQRARARSVLAAGRLRAAHPVGAGRRTARTLCGPWVQGTTDAERLWLDVALDANETVLAWLHTHRDATADPALSADAEAQHRFLLTDRRVALVAVSALGTVSGLVLDPEALTVTPGRRATVTSGTETWGASGNASLFSSLADLPAVSGAERMRAAAAAAREHGEDGARLIALVLGRLAPHADPYDQLVAAGQAEPLVDAAVASAVAALPPGQEGAQILARWMATWTPPPATADGVLRHLLDQAETPEEAAHSVSAHRTLRARQLAATTDPFAQAAVDLSFAEHLLFVGEHKEARQILRDRQPSLPTSDLAAVLPAEDADLAAYGGVSPVLVHLLELLAAPGPDGRRDPSALAALARQQPLVHARLLALSEAAAGDLQRRATEARTALEPDGLRPRPAEALPTFRALPAPMLEMVRHPAARQGGVLARVQSAVAKVKPPDVSAIRGFCERATLQRQPLLQRALTDACVCLGSPMASAYVSQGDQKVGLRSHEEPEPFLVIGGSHLDPDSDFYLPEAELRAAVGAEVAHLRFGHSRITSQDVWAGLMDKGATALTTTAALLPFLRFLPVDLLGREKTWRVVNTLVPSRWLHSIYGVKDTTKLASVVPGNLARLGDAGLAAVDTAEGGLGALQTASQRLRPGRSTPREENLGLDNVRLLAAHRVMQLTADRAGLMLSRDLRASIRAMFLTHTRLAYELSVAEQMGLPACLDRRDDEDRLLLPDLAVRVAALVSFWLSDEYAQLQDAGTV